MHATALCYVVDPIGRALFGQWSALLKGKFSRFVCRGRRVENKSVGGRWHFFCWRRETHFLRLVLWCFNSIWKMGGMQFGHLRAGSDDGNGVNLVGGKLREMFRDLSGSTRPSLFFFGASDGSIAAIKAVRTDVLTD